MSKYLMVVEDDGSLREPNVPLNLKPSDEDYDYAMELLLDECFVGVTHERADEIMSEFMRIFGTPEWKSVSDSVTPLFVYTD